MKYILTLLLFSIITCIPSKTNVTEELRQERIKRREKIIECVNKNGSETLKKLLNDSKDLILMRIIKENKDTISSEDRKVFFKCRKEALLEIQMSKKNLYFKNGTTHEL